MLRNSGHMTQSLDEKWDDRREMKQSGAYEVHLLLESLAERSTPNGPLLLRFGERHLADTVTHAVLLHH